MPRPSALLLPILSGLLILFIGINSGVSAANVSAAGQEFTSPYWQARLENGAIASLRYDPAGQGRYGAELVYRPLVFLDGETTLTLEPENVSLTADGRTLAFKPALAHPGALGLLWAVDCSPAGYYDRLTRQSLKTPRPEHPALIRFIGGATGNTQVIEAFKRMPDPLPGTLQPRNEAGKSVVVETADQAQFVLNFGEGGRHAYSFVKGVGAGTGDHFQVHVWIPAGALALTATAATGNEAADVRLPHFTFGADLPVSNTLGGKTTLNRLFNDFHMQASYWYYASSTIGLWGEMGVIGHGWEAGPYRVDTRNGLMTEAIGDDGQGHDGFAYAWGRERGWPFPGGYDTRHFSTNALQICGIADYLLWTGEIDKTVKRDFTLRGLHGENTVFAQDDQTAQFALPEGDNTFSQTFAAAEPFDALALNLRTEAVDPVTDQVAVIDQPLLPLDAKRDPLRPNDVPGHTVAQLVTPAQPFNAIGVPIGAYMKKEQGVCLRGFVWRGDYAQTIAQPPLAEKRVPIISENIHYYLPLPQIQPAGTPVLVVIDEPTSKDPTDQGQTWAAVWQYDDKLTTRPAGIGPMFKGAEAQPGHMLWVIPAMRQYPDVTLRLVTDKGEEQFKEQRRLPVNDGWLKVDLKKEMPAGRYAFEFQTNGKAVILWRGSAVSTPFPGEALMNGHPWNWLDRARRLMAYQMTALNAVEEKLIRIDASAGARDHTGVAVKTVGNNYYDILPFGYLDAYSNVFFYRSLRAMAELEKAYGDPAKAKEYEDFMALTRVRYNERFWTDKSEKDGVARYIGCVDATGARHDYGFTLINMQAAASGLASPAQAEQILHWLDTGKTLDGKGQWREGDIYRFGFAPRCTTLNNADWWTQGANDQVYPWNDQIQNGGAVLHESLYDLLTRMKTRGADDAWQRFMGIMRRYAEPDRLTGGTPAWDGAMVQGGGTAGAIGLMSHEFPETTIMGAAVLYVFLGVDVTAEGLRLTPRLPASQPFIRAENIVYHGTLFTIEAMREGTVKLKAEKSEGEGRFKIGDQELTAPFTWEGKPGEGGAVVIRPVDSREGDAK